MYSITAETESLAYRTCMFDNKFTPRTTEQQFRKVLKKSEVAHE